MSPTTRSSPILRWQFDHQPRHDHDHLAVEEPLEIRVRSRALCVTMRTPGHDHELAAGFLLSEALLRSPSDLIRIDPSPRHPEGNVVNVFLAPHVQIDLDKLTRHVFASSSCGLCGKATIDSIRAHFDAVHSDCRVPASVLLDLPQRLAQSQTAFNKTGGLHAAALFDLQGNLLALREDIGRHNAVDKILGYALLNNLLPLDHHILIVSGRASFEIVQKALAASIPIIAAVSAPSSLAVDFAADSNQTLVGFLRDSRMNLYTHPHRIQF